MTVGAPAEQTPVRPRKEASPMGQLFNVGIFVLFLALWAAFAWALAADQGGLDNVWARIRDLPILVQAVVWLLFLPLTVGLWIWESTWPLLVRLFLVAGIAGWNLWMFFPKDLVTR